MSMSIRACDVLTAHDIAKLGLYAELRREGLVAADVEARPRLLLGVVLSFTRPGDLAANDRAPALREERWSFNINRGDSAPE